MTQADCPRRQTADAASRHRSRVLVVDDERSMRELLAIVLRRDGYDVLVAEDGARRRSSCSNASGSTS